MFRQHGGHRAAVSDSDGDTVADKLDKSEDSGWISLNCVRMKRAHPMKACYSAANSVSEEKLLHC